MLCLDCMKAHLSRFLGEDRVFAPGDRLMTCQPGDFGTVGLAVCFDGDLPGMACCHVGGIPPIPHDCHCGTRDQDRVLLGMKIRFDWLMPGRVEWEDWWVQSH